MARRRVLVFSVLIPMLVALAGSVFDGAISQLAIAWPTSWKLWVFAATALVATILLEFVSTRPGSRAAPTPPERPQQLRAPPLRFVGRNAEIRILDRWLLGRARAGQGRRIVVIVGAGGIGKTALASSWADRHRNRFPDGQLYVDLNGFNPSNGPIVAEAVLRGFLAELGKDPGNADIASEFLAARFRSEVEGRRLLIILDNARNSAHVDALIPGSPTCVTIVTSRHRLTNLRTGVAHILDLSPLAPEDAQHLLRRHLGPQRLSTDPQAVQHLTSWCEGMPLAIDILAAHIQAHPFWPLTQFVTDLADESARRDIFESTDLSSNLRAALASSISALPSPAAAAAFHLLGPACGPDISLAAAANLIAQPITETRTTLSALEELHLIYQAEPGRYRMHDLVRLYATAHIDTDHTPQRRLVDFYVHTALAGNRLVDPHRRTFELDQSPPEFVLPPFADAAQATAWFQAEYLCLQAAQQTAAGHHWHTSVWLLAWALTDFQRWRARPNDYIKVWQTGAHSAEKLQSTELRAWAYRQLGQALSRVHDPASADYLHQALTLAEQTNDIYCQAATQRSLAHHHARNGDIQRALTHANIALPLYQKINNPVGLARAHNSVGWYHAQLAHYHDASYHCETALTLHRTHRFTDGEAISLESLGVIAHGQARHEDAIGLYRQALELFETLGNTYKQADTLNHLARTHAILGQHTQARHTWRLALDLYQAQYRIARAESVENDLLLLLPKTTKGIHDPKVRKTSKASANQ